MLSVRPGDVLAVATIRAAVSASRPTTVQCSPGEGGGGGGVLGTWKGGKEGGGGMAQGYLGALHEAVAVAAFYLNPTSVGGRLASVAVTPT